MKLSNIKGAIDNYFKKVDPNKLLTHFEDLRYEFKTINKQSMITINGKSYKGNNVTISNNEVYIDGVKQTPSEDEKTITINVVGDIEKLKVDSCESLHIKGNCDTMSTVNANLNIDGSIHGNVSSVNGDISCNTIAGSVSTVNGDVKSK